MAAKEENGSKTLSAQVRLNRAAVDADLAADGTLRWGFGRGEHCLNLESEVLGIDQEGGSIKIRAFLEVPEGGFCGTGGAAGGRRRVRRDYLLEMPTQEEALRWSSRLKNFMDSLCRPKKLFIVINPFAGKKCARTIFQTEIKPLLEAADILYTIVETTHQNHAYEMAKSLDLPQYDAIVCVSGDGVLVEVVNGLLKREDWATVIKIPLGVIPAGTGNGMVKSLLDSAGDLCSTSNATFAIIRGHIQSLDVATISQGEKRFFSVLSLIWGLPADVDIQSEKLRWLGSTRLDIYALLRIMNLRKYHGNVQFIPAPGYETYGEPMKQVDDHKDDGELSKHNPGGENKVKSCGYQGPEISLEGLEWRTVGGPFISVCINNVPFSAENYVPAPEAKFSDGYLDVSIVKECPISALLGMMLNMSDGSYVKSPYVMYLKVKAFRLEPGNQVRNPTKGGIIDSDGEVIARGDESAESSGKGYLMDYGPPIQMTVEQGLAAIFSPIA
ncbi:sphingosine kinase 1-like [Canna indica]|uniref:sphingosine kinase n=1 Tax=Canna indica TaxID=4628 RepID=A0AAQ3QLZ9_9LILI|nr:sphingosine kinase 1-like [Canna indica]